LNLDKDVVLIEKSLGDGSSIDRVSGSQTFRVIVKDANITGNPMVNVTEETKPINGSFYFSTDSAPTWDWGHIEQISGTNGQLETSHDPNCSYERGIQYWYAEIKNNDCYHDKEMPHGAGENTYYITGQLFVDIYEPLEDSEWNVTDLIDLGWNVYSDCYGIGPYSSENGNITGVTNTINLNHLGNTTSCDNINDPLSDGNYNCTWDSTSQAEGNWTVNLTAQLTNYNQNFTSYPNWFYLDNLHANLTNLFVTPSSGGWGTNYTYNITVTDNENDETSCQLYVNTTSGWTYKGIDTITPPGNCSISVDDYTCADQSSAEFYFIINDTYNTLNTSETLGETSGPTIGKNDVDFTLIEGNNSFVNRSDGSILGITQNFVLWVNDTTRNSNPLENTNGTIWITTDQNNFDSGNDTQTNQTGHLEIYFNPDCSYSPGQQYWIGGIRDDICYNEANTSINYTINVLGNITNYKIQPNGEKFLRGEENITIEINATSDCPSETLDTDVFVNLTYDNETGQSIACTPVTNEGSANYTCEFNTTGLRTRWHDIIVNTSKADYNNKSTTYSNAFWIETRPYMTIFNMTPLSDGWGKTRRFWVYSYDDDNDTLDVDLWYRMDGDPYLGNTSTNSSEDGHFKNLTFSLPGGGSTFDGGDIGLWYYKFNMTDLDGYTNETSEGTFTIEKDDTWVEYKHGNNTIVNRSAPPGSPYYSTVLGIRLWDIDIDPDDPLDYKFIRFFIANGTDGYEAHPSTRQQTNNNAYYNYTFYLYGNGNYDKCNYPVGPHNWTASMQGSEYTQYNMTNMSEYATITIVTTPLEARIESPYNQTRRKGTDPVFVKANVSDDCGLVSGANITIAIRSFGEDRATCCDSGCDATIYDEGNGTYNCTFSASTIDSLPSYGTYNLTVNATKQYYNDSLTWEHDLAFRLLSQPQIKDLSATPSGSGDTSGGWGETWEFQADVFDDDNDNLTVYLWFNYTGEWELADSQIWDNPGWEEPVTFPGHTFFCNHSVDLGTKFFKINASDVYGYNNNTEISTFTLVADDTIVDTYLSTSTIDLNREGSDSITLWAKFLDVDRASNPVANATNSTVWITYNGVDELVFSNQTDENGNITYYFDPNCSYETGIQTWKAGVINDVCYQNSPQPGDTLTIYGQLKNNLTLPLNGSEWNVTDSIIINFTTLSDCSDYISSENPVTSTSDRSIELSLDGSSWQECTSQDLGQGWVNCTWDSTNQDEGWWDIRANSSKQYYNDNSTIYTDRFWLENKNTTSENYSVAPSQGGWTRLYNYSVDLYDPEIDEVNCSLYVSKDDGNTWLYKGSMNVSGNGTCWITVHDFTCQDIGDDNKYKFELKNGEQANYRNTTIQDGPILNTSVVEVFNLT
jgi:hypothetical protein